MSNKSARILGWLPWLAPIAVYGLLAVLLTWPMARHLSTHLLGRSSDTPLHYWNSWWVQQALRQGQFPYYTRYLFHPDGVSLVTHNIAWGNALGFVLLEPLLGGIAAYNIVLILSLALCGCGAFALLWHLTRDMSAALLGGVIYQAWPFRLSQMGHPNLLATFWVPLFLLSLHRLIQHGQRRDALFTGLTFMLVGVWRWQVLIPATVLGLILVIAWVMQRHPTRRTWANLGLSAVIALILLAPAGWMLARQVRGDAGLSALFRDEERQMQTDLLAYITPAASHPLVGHLTGPLYDRYYADRQGGRYPAYLGLTALALALIGLSRRPRQGWPWAVLAGIMMLLAMGPLLRVNGRFHAAVPMPYRALEPLRVFSLMREPDRYNQFMALPIAALAALGLSRPAGHDTSRGALFRAGGVALLVGAVIIEYLPTPIPLDEIEAPSPAFAQMVDPSAAVLDLPIDPLQAKVYMFEQTQHRRPIVQGHLSRIPASAYAYLDATPWLATLRRQQEMAPWLPDVSRQLTRLAEDDIGYIMLHKELVGQDRIDHWRRYLLMRPRYEDEQVVLYVTAPVAGADFPLTHEMAPGIYLLRAIVSAEAQVHGGIVEVDIGWGTDAGPNANYDLLLTLVDGGGVARQVERFSLSPSWPPSEWPANAMLWDDYRFHVADDIAPGDYQLMAQLVDPRGEAGPQQNLGSLRVQVEAVRLASDNEATDVDALFGGSVDAQLRLIEYELEQRDGRLRVTLHWRAEQRMAADYTVFVHVYDPADGRPVAQDDAMPRRWAYPTRFWWPGEIVVDRFDIPLDGAPPGRYGVAIGVYDSADGARLSVVDAQGNVSPDGRLLLHEAVEVQ